MNMEKPEKGISIELGQKPVVVEQKNEAPVPTAFRDLSATQRTDLEIALNSAPTLGWIGNDGLNHPALDYLTPAERNTLISYATNPELTPQNRVDMKKTIETAVDAAWERWDDAGGEQRAA